MDLGEGKEGRKREEEEEGERETDRHRNTNWLPLGCTPKGELNLQPG